MALRNTKSKWGTISQSFHWLIALAIITMFAIGWTMTSMDLSPQKFKLYSWHKSLGLMILAFVLLRLMWRSVNVAPVLPPHMHKLEKWAAHLAHVALYICMIGMPLSGWLMSSSAGLTVNIFRWFEVPDLVTVNAQRAHMLREVHEWMAWGFAGLISAHILAALYHHFIYRDNVLTSMLPFGKKR